MKLYLHSSSPRLRGVHNDKFTFASPINMRQLQNRNMVLITQQRFTTCQYATTGLYDVPVKSCSLLCRPRKVPWTVAASHYSLPTVVCVTPPPLACGKQPKAPVAR
jgi:hypothetical protein